MSRLKVIFDTDPGIDDAMALLLLARHPDVELIGVTTVFGNAAIDTVTRNALFLKDKFGFAAPVARGADKPISGGAVGPSPVLVHGHNGLGDIDLPATVRSTPSELPAHQLIIELVRRYPHDVTIIAVGRMTNLALALAEAPDITALVHDVVVMGGAFGRNGHTGNVTPVAEANIFGDPVAADIVFGADWPLTIVGLDVTKEVLMTPVYIDELAKTGPDGAFVKAISNHYSNFYRGRENIEGFFVHDSSAVSYALHPEFFNTERGTIRVVPDGLAKGQTIIKPEGQSYPPGAWDNRPAQTICIGVDSQALLKLYSSVFSPAGFPAFG